MKTSQKQQQLMLEKKYTKEQLRHRTKLLQQLLKNYYQWKAYVEDFGLTYITIEGEEWCFYDILDGLETLPPRQKEAVILMCIEDHKEWDTAKEMGFTKWSTPVQVYRNIGLKKLLAFHEDQEKN